MTACCTMAALCSSSRRSRCDLPEPELPWTSRRVASSSSRSSIADEPFCGSGRHVRGHLPHIDADLHSASLSQHALCADPRSA